MRVPFEHVLWQVARTHCGATGRVGAKAGKQKPRRLEDVIQQREAAGNRITAGIVLALAVSSVGLAVYGIRSNAGYPVWQLDSASMKASRSAASIRSRDLDPETTGTIRQRTATLEKSADMSGRGYVLRGVLQGAALVEGPGGGLREVGPGTVLPGAGRIISIERAAAGWVVVTSETVIGNTLMRRPAASPGIDPT